MSNKVFYYSFVLHVALLFVLFFSPLLHSKPKIIEFKLLPPMEMMPLPSVEAEALPVEPESLLPPEPKLEEPSFVIPEKPKPKPKPEPKKVEAPKPKPKPEPKKEVKPAAPPKPKPLSPELRRKLLEKKMKAIDSQVTDIKSDSQMSGVTTTQHFPYQQYLASLQKRITQAWDIPSHLALETNLNAYVTFTIARDGGVQKVGLKSSSGKLQFDQSILSAIESAAPFSSLPDDYKESVLEITIRFQLDQ